MGKYNIALRKEPAAMGLNKSVSKAAKGVGYAALVLIVGILIYSAVDVYNNFAYERAIVKDSPYGMTPLLLDPKDYGSADGFINSGDFVYVEDWISAVNGRIVFSKVKTKFKEGYINKELLVPTNLNLKPMISMLLLLAIFFIVSRKLYYKFSNQNIV